MGHFTYILISVYNSSGNEIFRIKLLLTMGVKPPPKNQNPHTYTPNP